MNDNTIPKSNRKISHQLLKVLFLCLLCRKFKQTTLQAVSSRLLFVHIVMGENFSFVLKQDRYKIKDHKNIATRN